MAKKRSAAQKRATAKLVALNKARRSGGAKRRRPARSASVTRASNPAPRRRRRKSASVKSVTTRVVRRRRNPAGGMGEFVTRTLMPSAIGGGGALLLDVALGMLPIPPALKVGPMAPIVRIAGAIGLGFAASKVTSRQTANQIAAGALTVTMYNIARGALVRMSGGKIPGLAGDEYVGEYVGEYVSGPPSEMQPLSFDDGVGYISSGQMVGEVDDDGSVGDYETGVYR